MFKKDDKKNFPQTVFIIAALAALLALSAVYLGAKLRLADKTASLSGGMAGDEYYLKDEFPKGDPLLTRRPGLDDMLAGPILSSADPNQGYEDAPVTIVIFSDFECSFCYAQEQVLKKLVGNYKYRLKLIWKDYPPGEETSASFQAAIAARCAQRQGNFWPFHDMLFDSHGDLNREKYDSIAGMLGLDMDKFSRCLASGETKKLVLDNMEEADALGIKGVPFIYLNDREIMGEVDYAELEELVEMELGN